MTQRIEILGAEVTRQDSGRIMVENDRPSYATHGLPDPNLTGPCQLQASPFCLHVGGQVMDPMDMTRTETAFRAYVHGCLPCYEAQADEFVRVTHGRD